MKSYKNLTNKDGIDKLKELIKSIDVCMFASNLSGEPISARPMSTRDIDDDGTIWFFSQASSNVNREIIEDDNVQLFYGNLANSEYLNISGHATISRDKQKIKVLWSAWAKTWFTGGVNDPELTMIKVEPENVYYWDTKHNKMMSLLKIVTGTFAAKGVDDGNEGLLVM